MPVPSGRTDLTAIWIRRAAVALGGPLLLLALAAAVLITTFDARRSKARAIGWMKTHRAAQRGPCGVRHFNRLAEFPVTDEHEVDIAASRLRPPRHLAEHHGQAQLRRGRRRGLDQDSGLRTTRPHPIRATSRTPHRLWSLIPGSSCRQPGQRHACYPAAAPYQFNDMITSRSASRRAMLCMTSA